MKGKKLSRRQFVGHSLAVSAALSYRNILGANDRITIGMIGCGNRCQGSLLKDILEFSRETNVEVVGICDTWRQMREKATEQVLAATGRKPSQYIRYHDLLATGVDAVVICTPEHQHCTQLIDAIRAGKDVYVEKPLGMTMDEISAAYDVVKASDRIVQNGTQIRSLPAAQAAKRLIAEGDLGVIVKAEQSRNGVRPFWYGYAERQVSRSDVDWEGFLMNVEKRPFDPKQYAGWYGFREFCRGPHTTQGLHFIDLVQYITGAGAPQYATAHFSQVHFKDGFTVPDSVEITYQYPEGFLVRYGQFFGNGSGRYLNIYGTGGQIDCSNWSWNGQWKLSRNQAVEGEAFSGKDLPQVEGTPHMKNWLDCLRTRQQPIAPIEAGHAHAVAGILAEEANLRGRRMVYLPDLRKIREA
ncbi:MAG TPA: Gfo/Idh/MocA family oxidoreductase [Acidobacteriota bacterium]|nr:Gfo/Idh/MocA family oxidoreductase [Acidobacteriota bacterium]